MGVVVFTDLADSTAMRSRLGDERADDVRRQHDSLVRGVLESHGGRIVKHLGDGFMAVFGSAARAVDAAVDLQQSLERHNTRPLFGEGLVVRVGISAGDVQWEDEDCFGTPVVEAARLVGRADGGQVLASAVVKLLAGTRTNARLVPIGPMELKGLAEPLEVVEAHWDRADTTAIPLPSWLDPHASRTPLAGRDRELTTLERAWERAVAGERGVVLVAGEAGVGKSRFLSEFAATVHGQQATVLGGRCEEGRAVPYKPVVEALRQFVDAAAVDSLADSLGRYAGDLTRLLPELTERLTNLPPPLQSDAEVEAYRLYEAVAAWLAEAVAGDRPPLLLVVDDLQGATTATCQMLEHVIERTAAEPILFLIGYRDDEVTRTHAAAAFLGSLARVAGVERLQLGALGSDAIGALVDDSCPELSAQDRERLAAELEARTEGNAFFVGELLRYVKDVATRDPERAAGAALPLDALHGVPESVRTVIWMRVGQLPEAAVQTLTVAAVMGPDFDIAILAAAARIDRREVVEHLAAAEERGLIGAAGPGRYRFLHGLVQSGIYEDLASMRRAALHHEIADAIEAVAGDRLSDHCRDLARHLQLAGIAADPSRAAHYSMLAGRQALAQHASDEALALLQASMDWMANGMASIDDETRCDLLLDFGDAQARTGDPGYHQTLRDAARLAEGLGDGERMARAIKATSRALPTARPPTSEIALIERALALLGDHDSAARASLLAQQSSELFFSGGDESRLALLDEALAVARRVDDPSALAYVLAVRDTTVHTEHYSPDELVAASRRCGDPRYEFLALLVLDDQCLYHGDLDGARAAVQRAETLADELGDARMRFGNLVARSRHAMADGALADAEQLANDALELGQRIEIEDAILIYGMQMISIRFLQDRLSELAHLLHLPVLIESTLVDALAVRALLACAAGDRDLGRRLFDDIAADGFATLLQRGTNPVVRLAIACQVCVALEDTARADELYELCAPFRDRFATVTMAWAAPMSYPLGRLCGLMGRTDEARDLLAAASAAVPGHDALQALIASARRELDQGGRGRRAEETIG